MLAKLLVIGGVCIPLLALDAPVVSAVAKGPNQINLTWPTVAAPGYGYLVEIQSAGDARYSSFTEMQPIATGSGYKCDPALAWGGGDNRARTGCTISDPDGTFVYNPAVKGIPAWVTETQYIDPQDGTPAQFIAWGLKSNTKYSFRVRTYEKAAFGSYSSTASATTADYTARYVSPAGSNANTGLDPAHAWATITFAAGKMQCGQVLYLLAGTYTNDNFSSRTNCTAASKLVIQANPGDAVTVTTSGTLFLSGASTVLDSLVIQTSNIGQGYSAWIDAPHVAMLNVSMGPAVVPSSWGGLSVRGSGTGALIYRSYFHDFGSPDDNQNSSGGGGFPIEAGSNGTYWSNHITRGGHDCFLAHDGNRGNRVLNSVHDGGWGMAFEAISTSFDAQQSSGNLFEGVIGPYAARLQGNWYKPAFELSAGRNTVRRGQFFGYSSTGIEISYFAGKPTAEIAGGNLVYNNVFFGGSRPYFQNNGTGLTPPFDGTLVMNNIFADFSGAGTTIYRDNLTPGALSYNTFQPSAGNASPYLFTWFLDGPGSFGHDNACPDDHTGGGCSGHGSGRCDAFYDEGFRQSLSYMQACFTVVWNHNLSSDPLFVDAAGADFHLRAGSPVLAAGTRLKDEQWAFPVPDKADVDQGAFGLATPITVESPVAVVPVVVPAVVPPVVPAGVPVVVVPAGAPAVVDTPPTVPATIPAGNGVWYRVDGGVVIVVVR